MCVRDLLYVWPHDLCGGSDGTGAGIFEVYQRMGPPWGMPSFEALCGFLLALHLSHFVYAPLGAAVAIPVAYAVIVAGPSPRTFCICTLL
jgi:hypothetical protein